MANQEILILYILLGAIAGIVYSLRRIYMLERKILEIDRKITELLKKKRK